MGDSLDVTSLSVDTTVETQNVAIVDYGEFANYIRKAATILLPEEDATAPALNVALDDKVNQDCIKKFLSDSQIQALYIQRTSSKGECEKLSAFLPFSGGALVEIFLDQRSLILLFFCYFVKIHLNNIKYSIL